MSNIETVSQMMRNNYRETNYPSSKIVDVTNGQEDDSVEYYPFEGISKLPENLFPVGSVIKNGKLHGIFREKDR